jgi:hypothetical protein
MSRRLSIHKVDDEEIKWFQMKKELISLIYVMLWLNFPPVVVVVTVVM